MRQTLAVVLVLLALPSAASAASARVAPRSLNDIEDCDRGVTPCYYAMLEYRGAPGEANSLEVSSGGAERTYRLRDTGADIQPGTGCQPEGPRQVRCEIPADAGFHELEASMGDMDDEVSLAVPIVNLVQGEAGDDRLTGSTTTDRFEGGAGRDRLSGGDGADFLYDGVGGGGIEPDVFSGGAGTDEIGYFDRSGPVRVDLRPGGSGGEAGEGDTYSGIESVRGGRGDDVFRAGEDGVIFYGGRGRDRLYGGYGPDTILGEEGSDKLYGSFGRDRLYGDDGNDGIDGGCDADVLTGGRGNDRLYGADGSRDKIGGSSGTDFARFDQADVVRNVERRSRLHVDACAL
jgi:hypothetical protein